MTKKKQFKIEDVMGFMLSAVIVCTLLFLTSCNETGVNPDSPVDQIDETEMEFSVNPQSVLNGQKIVNTQNVQSKRRPAQNGEFSGQLFGLTTAPNGDILVADAGAGIVTQTGRLDIALPGAADMDALGRGSMWAIKGLTGDPGDDTGQALYRATRGKNRLVVDLFEYEETNNPDGADIDSNPFDVQSLGGQAVLVVDAAGNDLLRVNNRGHIELMALFPDELVSTANIKALFGCPAGPPDFCGLPDMIPTQSVPTSIAVDEEGYIYVGELKGFPAPTDASDIWRVSPDASGITCGSGSDCTKVFDGGFTSIIDLAYADGKLYVAELDESSWFALELGTGSGGLINECDLTTGTCNEIATGIPMLTAITFGKDGSLWAIKNALVPGIAEVIKVF
jgi:hypothetical protein